MATMTRIGDILGEDSWCKKTLSLWNVWNSIAGSTLTKDTFAYKYEGGSLFIGVRHQYLITELPYLERELVERAKKFYPDIKRLKLVYLPAQTQQPPKPIGSENGNITRRQPNELELKFANNLAQKVHSDKVRTKFHAAMKSYLTLYEIEL